MSNKRKYNQTLIINYFTTPASSSLPSDETETDIIIRSNGNKKIRIEVSHEKEEVKEIPPKKEKLYKCTKCRQLKHISKFSLNSACTKKKINSWCRVCTLASQKIYHNTVRGALQQLIKTARCSAILRGKRGRKEAGQCTLTINDLLERYNF